MSAQLTIYDEIAETVPHAGGGIWPLNGGQRWGWIAHAGPPSRQLSRLGVEDDRQVAANRRDAAALLLFRHVYGGAEPLTEWIHRWAEELPRAI